MIESQTYLYCGVLDPTFKWDKGHPSMLYCELNTEIVHVYDFQIMILNKE